MLVYGDRSREVDLSPEIDRLETLWVESMGTQSWVERHGRLCTLFIAVAELVQAVGDDAPDAEPAFLALTMAAAAALRRSWDDQITPPPPPADLFAAARAVAPERLTVKTAEGYAFYALYPETYREAARPLSPETHVVGIRSIGVGLGCVVADAIGAPPPLTVRPSGDPFNRTVDLPPLDPAGRYAIVDEGPGFSGSSFGGVADALEAQGVPTERIAFFPSHANALGAQASEANRRRWASARRLHVPFETLIAPRLPEWVEDLTGPASAVDDISGGVWRTLTHGPDEPVWPPVAAQLERRKLLLTTHTGQWLLKFVGLGEHGLVAYDRARALHVAGFTPEPAGWRHGFLVERWLDSRPATPDEIRAALPAYLTVRATLPAAEFGGSAAQLAEMARANIAEALGPEIAARVPDPPATIGPAVAVDARLHAWEWRTTADGRTFKTDALDHGSAHDLIGPQPIAWDHAGALVEHDIPAPDLHPFWPVAYAAFQLGLWTMAGDVQSGGHAVRCRQEARRYASWLLSKFTRRRGRGHGDTALSG